MADGRKIVYVLGAGASRGAGAVGMIQGGGELRIPIQSDFWRTFLKFCRDKNKRKRIESFLFRYFTDYDRVPGKLKPIDRWQLLDKVDVEEVFTFISERTRSEASSPQLKAAVNLVWDDLTAELINVFGRFHANKATKHVYRHLRKNQIKSRDTIVSFNYDLIFEQSIPRKYWAYEGLEETTRKFGVIKPHGSINWDIVGIDVVVDNHPTNPLIVAPTHLKFIGVHRQEDGKHPKAAGYIDQQLAKVREIWTLLEKELREAKAIIFIGYSFPSADLYFSSVLRTIIGLDGAKPKFVLVNPDAVNISGRIRDRFRIETKNYFDLSQFAEISRNSLLKAILKK